MSTHANMVKMGVTSVAGSGTGTITLGAASSGYRHINAAITASATVDILITEGTAWEVARNCAYTYSATPSSCTIDRGTLESSSTGSAVTFTSAAVVSVVATAAFGNNAETLMGAFGLSEISVTAATTATIGRMHHCTGTSADYTVTLPAASGNAGKLIGFRMGSASALTKLVTLDGNAGETIDGAPTRLMWATETAILLCDGSNWFKIAGRSNAMVAGMQRSANQSGIVDKTSTTITLDTSVVNNTGAMVNTGSNRIDIKRAGTYLTICSVRWEAPNTVADGSAYFYLNATTDFVQVGTCMFGVSATAAPSAQSLGTYSFAAGDYIQLRGYQTSGASKSVSGPDCLLSVVELPSW